MIRCTLLLAVGIVVASATELRGQLDTTTRVLGTYGGVRLSAKRTPGPGMDCILVGLKNANNYRVTISFVVNTVNKKGTSKDMSSDVHLKPQEFKGGAILFSSDMLEACDFDAHIAKYSVNNIRVVNEDQKQAFANTVATHSSTSAALNAFHDRIAAAQRGKRTGDNPTLDQAVWRARERADGFRRELDFVARTNTMPESQRQERLETLATQIANADAELQRVVEYARQSSTSRSGAPANSDDVLTRARQTDAARRAKEAEDARRAEEAAENKEQLRQSGREFGDALTRAMEDDQGEGPLLGEILLIAGLDYLTSKSTIDDGASALGVVFAGTFRQFIPFSRNVQLELGGGYTWSFGGSDMLGVATFMASGSDTSTVTAPKPGINYETKTITPHARMWLGRLGLGAMMEIRELKIQADTAFDLDEYTVEKTQTLVPLLTYSFVQRPQRAEYMTLNAWGSNSAEQQLYGASLDAAINVVFFRLGYEARKSAAPSRVVQNEGRFGAVIGVRMPW